MTAPDMESIIAAALGEHWRAHVDIAGDDIRYVCECGAVEIVKGSGHSSTTTWSRAHQARAVLAAISEAGAVAEPNVCAHALDNQGAEFGPKSPCTKPTGHDQYHRDNTGVAFGPYQGDPNE